jgi:hypothetical protein
MGWRCFLMSALVGFAAAVAADRSAHAPGLAATGVGFRPGA